MTRTEVVAAGRAYTVNALDPQATGHVVQAIAFARVVDALTGDPVRAPTRMTTSTAGLLPRSTTDGVVGLLGRPSQVFPSLRTQAYALQVRITASGHAARDEQAVIPVTPAFPGEFAPADLGVLLLLPDPVSLDVATFEDLGPGTGPVGGADVRVTRSWATVDRIGGPASVDPLLAVGPGLSARRPSGSAVDVPVLVAPAEPVRTLTAGVAPGTTRLAVSTTGALVAGDVVSLDGGDPDLAEWIEVVEVVGPGTAGSAAELGLRFPVQHAHRPGVPVRRHPAPPAGAAAAVLVTEALAGGRTLVIGALGGIAVGQVVRITGGTAAPEYQVARHYRTTTNASGAGRLAPVTGLAAVEISAVAGPLAAAGLASLTRPRTTRSFDLTLR